VTDALPVGPRGAGPAAAPISPSGVLLTISRNTYRRLEPSVGTGPTRYAATRSS